MVTISTPVVFAWAIISFIVWIHIEHTYGETYNDRLTYRSEHEYGITTLFTCVFLYVAAIPILLGALAYVLLVATGRLVRPLYEWLSTAGSGDGA